MTADQTLRGEPSGDRAVFLDRDGTLNVERGFITRPDQLELIDGAASALRRLRAAGFRLIVVSNQSAIARGLMTEGTADEINRSLEAQLQRAEASVDAIYVCPHHPAPDGIGGVPELSVECGCRKPATGLIDRACADFSLDRSRSWLVGDHSRDIETARRAGLKSILVRTGHAGRDGEWAGAPDFVAQDMLAAAALIEAHSA